MKVKWQWVWRNYMTFKQYIETEPIQLKNMNIEVCLGDLDSVNEYYKIVEERIKQNEYFIQDNE